MRDPIKTILEKADIKLNGTRPWDIKVNNPRWYDRVLSEGSLGLGESYMDGLWDVPELDKLSYKIFRNKLYEDVLKMGQFWLTLFILRAKLFNLQNKLKSREVGKKHYDVGNELYENMLDKRMVYTCAYWKDAKNLDEAQENKLKLVCEKLNLKKGQRILDIGCGWGSFAKYAVENYGVSVVGVTISAEQAKLARELCQGLSVEIKLQDYREIEGKFDHVVSLGMFEHVGYKNYEIYMQVVSRVLKDDGLFLLQTFGNIKSVSVSDRWLNKYIFPGGMTPSVAQIGRAIENLLVMEDWHNFGADYDKTLMAWHRNFINSWDKIKDKYDVRFKRMWEYYLLSLAGAFRARKIQLWQIVFSKKGVKGGYKSIR